MLFAMTILIIFYVLESVVVTSKRYYFLENKQLEEIRKYISLRQMRRTFLSLGGLHSNK